MTWTAPYSHFGHGQPVPAPRDCPSTTRAGAAGRAGNASCSGSVVRDTDRNYRSGQARRPSDHCWHSGEVVGGRGGRHPSIRPRAASSGWGLTPWRTSRRVWSEESGRGKSGATDSWRETERGKSVWNYYYHAAGIPFAEMREGTRPRHGCGIPTFAGM